MRLAGPSVQPNVGLQNPAFTQRRGTYAHSVPRFGVIDGGFFTIGVGLGAAYFVGTLVNMIRKSGKAARKSAEETINTLITQLEEGVVRVQGEPLVKKFQNRMEKRVNLEINGLPYTYIRIQAEGNDQAYLLGHSMDHFHLKCQVQDAGFTLNYTEHSNGSEPGKKASPDKSYRFEFTPKTKDDKAKQYLASKPKQIPVKTTQLFDALEEAIGSFLRQDPAHRELDMFSTDPQLFPKPQPIVVEETPPVVLETADRQSEPVNPAAVTASPQTGVVTPELTYREKMVHRLYQHYLGREPDPTGFRHYVDSQCSEGEMGKFLKTSDERKGLIKTFCRGYWGREAYASDLQYWAESERSVDEIRKAMLDCPKRYTVVTQVYKQVTGRLPQDYILGELGRSDRTLDQLKTMLEESERLASEYPIDLPTPCPPRDWGAMNQWVTGSVGQQAQKAADPGTQNPPKPQPETVSETRDWGNMAQWVYPNKGSNA